MPWLGPQLTLTTGVRAHAWRVELGAIYRAPTRVVAEADPAAGARVRMWALAARGCGVLHPGPLELGLCGGLEAGQVIGEGFGYGDARRDPIPWVALTLGPALSYAPRRWLALWLGVDLALPVVRGTFAAAGLGRLYTVGPVSLRGALGLEFRFP